MFTFQVLTPEELSALSIDQLRMLYSEARGLEMLDYATNILQAWEDKYPSL